MALEAPCCSLPGLCLLLNQSRWMHQTCSLRSPPPPSHALMDAPFYPLQPHRAQQTSHWRFSGSALPRCSSILPKYKSRALRAAWHHPGATSQCSHAEHPANSYIALLFCPALSSPGHVCSSDAKACIAFLSKHQCPYVPSNNQIRQEILSWEWGELCSKVVTLDTVFLAISS